MKKTLTLICAILLCIPAYLKAGEPTPNSWYAPLVGIGSFASFYLAKHYWKKTDAAEDLSRATWVLDGCKKNEELSDHSDLLLLHRLKNKYNISEGNNGSNLNDLILTRKKIARKYFPHNRILKDENDRPFSNEQIRKNSDFLINGTRMISIAFIGLGVHLGARCLNAIWCSESKK